MFGWIKDVFGNGNTSNSARNTLPVQFSLSYCYDEIQRITTTQNFGVAVDPKIDNDRYLNSGSPGFFCDDGVLMGRTDIRRPHLRSDLLVNSMLEFAAKNQFDLYPSNLEEYKGDCNLYFVTGFPHILGVTHVGGMSVVDLMSKQWTADERKQISRTLTYHSDYGAMEMVAEAVIRVNGSMDEFKAVVAHPVGMSEEEYNTRVWNIAFIQTLKDLRDEYIKYANHRAHLNHQECRRLRAEAEYDEAARQAQAANPPSVVDRVAKFAYENPLLTGFAIGMLMDNKNDRK